MRKFAFAVLAIFFASGSYAQEEVQDATDTLKTKKFSWGVKANVNLASERNAPEDRSRTGFAAGFFAELKINDRFSFQPELLYSQQGSWQYLNKGARNTGDNTLQYDYLNLPLLLKIYVWSDKLSLELGPQIGYMISFKEKREPKNATKRIEKLDEKWMNKFDVAAAIGASYKFYGPFDAYVRYTYGFLNIYKDDTGILDDSQKKYYVDNKNSVFQLGIAARF